MTKYTENDNYVIRTNDDGSKSWIPKSLENSDYQEYLAANDSKEL
jgi:hypothetical protein